MESVQGGWKSGWWAGEELEWFDRVDGRMEGARDGLKGVRKSAWWDGEESLS